MGLGADNEPPKKKLKQAQLCFTPKSQKRKLVSDVDDEVQFVKIIRKETAVEDKLNVSNKENHLSIKKVFSPDLEKRVTVNSETSYPVVDLTGEEAFISPQDVSIPLSKNNCDEQSNAPDFSLSISDSILDAINSKSPSEETQADATVSVEISAEKTSEEVKNTQSDLQPSLNSEIDDTLVNLNDSLDDSMNETKSEDEDDACLTSPNEDLTPKEKGKKNPNTPQRKLTPKRLASLLKKEEQERLKAEKKAERAKQKEEKIKMVTEEKQRKKEEKKKKKLAEQKQKEEERKAKDEEKRKKEDEKKQKEEEKKKKDEEKRKREEAKEEEKRKKEELEEKKKAAFAKFFRKSKGPEMLEKYEEVQGNNFMPFPVKPDMKLAPQTRRMLLPEEKEFIDSYLVDKKDSASNFLCDIRSKKHIPLKSEATWPLSLVEEEHDVIIIESTTNENCADEVNDPHDVKGRKKEMKAKLLQFHDNRRPPYWGTWRKSSKAVTPRRPLGQDKVIFDYEVDSDSEWEDEGEGEDIEKEEGDSDGEEGEEDETPTGENGYILDNTFVPHGYLSDEEVQPDEDVEDNDPENQKIRMTLLKQEFDEEMKTKTERLKPQLLGCVWISNGTTEVSSGSLYERLMTYRAVWAEEAGTIDITGPIVEDSPTSTPQTKKIFPQTVLSSLVKFVHGCSLPLASIIKEFLVFIEKEHPSEHVSKRALTLKIKEIASKTYDYSTSKPTWSINSPLFEEFGLEPINEVKTVPPLPTLPLSIPEKPKESPLINFFNKGTTTPTVKKKVPFVTLDKPGSFDYTPSKLNEHGRFKNFGTPRPVDPVLKKRAQLITLSTSAGTSSKDEISQSASKENCIDAPVNNSIEAPVNNSMEAPVSNSVDAPVNNSVEAPVNSSSSSIVIDICED